jgi:hypothetical protein
MEKIRIFTDNEKNQAFELYANGKGLKEIATTLKLDFQASKHEKKGNKTTTTPATVDVNGSLLNLHQFLKKLDKARFEEVHTTANYIKGGRKVVDKVNAATAKFLDTLHDLTGLNSEDYPDLNVFFGACFKQATAMDKAAEAEAEARKQAEATERKAKREDKKFESYSVEELEAILKRKKAALSAK